jgi:hypothetical protein
MGSAASSAIPSRLTFILAVGAITAGVAGGTSGWSQRAAVILGSAAGLAFIVVTLLQLA